MGYVATVEFGTSKIICTLSRGDEKGNVEIIGLGKASYAGIHKGKWVAPFSVPDAVLDAIDECERLASKRIRYVNVGVPPCFMDIYICEKTINIKNHDGKIFPEHISQLMKSAQEIRLPPKSKIVGGRPVYYRLDDGSYYLNPVNRRSMTLMGKIAFAAADTEFINDMTYMFDNLRIQIDEFIPESFAKATYLIPAFERDMMAVLVDVGCYSTNLCIVHGDSVVYSKTIHMGGADICEDLSKLLEIDYATADKLKRRYTFGLYATELDITEYVKTEDGKLQRFLYTDIQKIIDDRVEYLSTIIYNEIENAGIPLSNRSKIFLTGGGIATMQGIKTFVEKLIPMKVVICKISVVNYSSPLYHTSLSLIDASFKPTLMEQDEPNVSLIQKFLNFFTGR